MIFRQGDARRNAGLGRGLEVIRERRNPTCGSKTSLGARDIDGHAKKKKGGGDKTRQRA